MSEIDLAEFVGNLIAEDDVDVLREGVRVLAQALMDAEVSGQIGAPLHERTPERTAHRNGYRTRTWDTRVGTVELRVPKVVPGSYFPSLLEPRRRAERAFAAVVQDAYVKGVSTRKVDDLVRTLGIDGIPKSEVSRICAELDGEVQAFLRRPIEGPHTYLWLDPTDHKVRRDGRVLSMATVVAVGVSAEGERHVLGVDVRRLGGRGLLDAVPALARRARAQRCPPGRLRRPRRAPPRARARVRRRLLAKMPGALHAQPARRGPQAGEGTGRDLDAALGLGETPAVPHERLQLGEDRARGRQWTPVRVMVSQAIRQHEGVEGVVLRRGDAVALTGPSPEARAHSVDRVAPGEQRLHEQPLGSLDRDRHAGPRPLELGAQVPNALAIVREVSFDDPCTPLIEDTELVAVATPISR